MILSDSSIKQRLQSESICLQHLPNTPEFDPYSQINPASIDFRLGNNFKFYKRNKTILIDPRDEQWRYVEEVIVPRDGYFIMHPGQFALGVTMESIHIPHDLVGICEWKSSIGRLWLIIHSTAGLINPWWKGTITLEMTNLNEVPIKLYPGMRIGQYLFQTIEWDVEVTYDKKTSSKYQGQIAVWESKFYKED
jgi:dCTP deaminase